MSLPTRRWLLAGLFLLPTIVPAAASTTPQLSCPYPCKAARPRIGPFDRRDVVTVKFNDGLRLRAHDGQLVDRADDNRGVRTDPDLLAALQKSPVVRWEPTHDVPEEQLSVLCRQAAVNLGRPVPDLNLQFTAHLSPDADPDAVLETLNALACVEMALPVQTPPPLPLPPVLDSRQDELLSPSTGIGSRLMWTWPAPIGGAAGTSTAGRGAGVRIVDIEYSWNLAHNDLPSGIAVIGTPGPDPFNDNHHGTAVLGQIGALDNGWGTIGAAPAATLMVTSAITSAGSYNVAAAVSRAAAAISAGDIILIEQQAYGPNVNAGMPNSQFGLVPCEWVRPTYDAILVAVGAGRIVVQAAGNGEQNLDLPVYSVGNGGHYPFQPANDSGAIIVGAGCPVRRASSADRSRLWFSNYGATVDVQAAGEAVFTTGYGDWFAAEGVNRLYTGDFGGTSSASPIIAAAAAIVQSSHKQLRGTPLSASALRSALVSTGSPQQPGEFPATQRIGPRPNVPAAILAALNAADCNASGVPDEIETIDPPTITAFYEQRSILSGQSISLGMTLTGTGASPQIRWYRGIDPGAVLITSGPSSTGTIFSNADTALLTLTNAAVADAGLYRCVVTTSCGATIEADTELLVTAACLADVNRDTVVGVQDVFSFLQFWFAGDTRADLDGRPGVSLEDLFTFLVAYFANDCV